MNHCELMFVRLCVTGGFRLKYAPSHISDGPDNADWRTRGGWRKFLRPRFHGGSLFPGSCLWAAWSSFCVRHRILWTGPTCQGLCGQSPSTRAWKKPSSRGDYSLHTQTVHVTRSPTPFQLVLIFLHWGSEMINLLILRKWKLFWGYLVLTLSGAFGLDWELLKHFFVRAYLCLFLTVHDFIVQQFSKTTNQRWILFSILL